MSRTFLNKLKNYKPVNTLTNQPHGTPDSRSEKWVEQQEKYGFDARDTWSLDLTMTELLYERLHLYLQEASDVIHIRDDQRAAIEKMIELAATVLEKDGSDEITVPASKELWELWAEYHTRMWW